MTEESDKWKTLWLPENLWDRMLLILMRKLKENGESSEGLFSEDKTVRVATRVRGMELLLIDLEEEYLRQ